MKSGVEHVCAQHPRNLDTTIKNKNFAAVSHLDMVKIDVRNAKPGDHQLGSNTFRQLNFFVLAIDRVVRGRHEVEKTPSGFASLVEGDGAGETFAVDLCMIAR